MTQLHSAPATPRQIEIIPAIDIIGGRCVRLSQGDYARRTEYTQTPAEMARMYADAGVGRIHLVDLDGAKAGHPVNLDVLHEIASDVDIDIEWGGGIKDDESLAHVLEAGAGHAIIGSLAVKEPQTMMRWLNQYGGEKIILGADLRNGKVAISGWLEDTAFSIRDLIDMFIPCGLKEVICTDISKDGMLRGPATELYTALAADYPGITFTVSGGISSMADIKALDSLGLPRVIVGKAIYEGKITLHEIREFIRRLSD